jgi:hypothetical protein
MSILLVGLKFVQTYLDDCLILMTGSWDNHLSKLEMVLAQLQAAGLQ